MKTSLLLFCFAALLMSSVVPVGAQSALDGFDPNTDYAVYVVVSQPDGKILVGGNFLSISPNGGPSVARSGIARLNADGTLDTAFNPNYVNGPVYAIALQPDGKILIGGRFNLVSGQTRRAIARLDATTGQADSFNPAGNGNNGNIIYAIALQADGKVIVGGNFTDVMGGQLRNRIARLDGTTGSADSFNPNVTGGLSTRVSSIAVQGDGEVLVGGRFTSVGGQPRVGIARVDGTTGQTDSFNPNVSGEVYAIAVQPDGKILVGGDFSGERNNIARFDPATGAADSFDPDATGGFSPYVHTIAVQPDGRILVGGNFTSIGGQTRNNIARLDGSTGAADSFDPESNSVVKTFAVQADGKIVVGGEFTTLAPNGGTAVTRNHIARLETDGRLDRTVNLGLVGNYILVTAVQPDGKILLGGAFTSVLGVPRNNIARLNSDGTLDMAFDPNSIGEVDTIAVQTDGKILVGGAFASIGGQPRNRIARLDATTGLADSFDPNASNAVVSIAVQADGKILAGGGFGIIGGQPRNRIARLDPMTGLAETFNPDANGYVASIAVQADGKILVGGGFDGINSIGGQARNHMARLDPMTGLADSFDPNANDAVSSIAVQADGKILVGGGFTNIGGQTRSHIARLSSDTALADSFNPDSDGDVDSIAVQVDGKILAGGFFTIIGGQGRNRIARLDGATGSADSFDPNANEAVLAIAVQADGKILAGGQFTNIGGQARNCIARLSNDTSALQDLVATQTAITWALGGSRPQYERVAFESSTDNANYTPLGNGTAVGNNWTLTGLNLPIGQNFYFRARGYYRGGHQNASASISESVRSVFTPLPLTPTKVISRKLHSGSPRDIDLSLTNNSGIECRSGGPTNDHQIIFTFPSAVTFTNAAVTVGTGSVSSSSGTGTTIVTVNLTGVSNAQTVTVTLGGVSDGANTRDVSVQMGVLVGDTNGNGIVNASDVGQTKSRIGQTVDLNIFRSDINNNGTINASDVAAVKLQIGTSIPQSGKLRSSVIKTVGNR